MNLSVTGIVSVMVMVAEVVEVVVVVVMDMGLMVWGLGEMVVTAVATGVAVGIMMVEGLGEMAEDVSVIIVVELGI